MARTAARSTIRVQLSTTAVHGARPSQHMTIYGTTLEQVARQIASDQLHRGRPVRVGGKLLAPKPPRRPEPAASA